MRKVHLVCSFLLAMSASMFGLGCGGGGGAGGGGSMSGGTTPSVPGTTPAAAPAAAVPLAWLPAETEAVIHVKVADLWKASLFKSLTGSQQAAQFVEEMKSKTGLAPSDIESLTIGAADLQGIQTAAASQMIGAPAAPPKGLVGVIKTTKSVTLEDLSKSDDLKTAEHGSKKFLQSADADMGLYVADPQTILVAGVEDLKAAIDRGMNKTPRQELGLIDGSSHIILVAAPKDPKSLTANIGPAPADAPAEVAAMQQTLAESLTAAGIGLSIRGGMDLKSALMLDKADGVDKVKAGFTASVDKAKQELDAAKESVPPLFGELGDMFLKNVKVESDSQTVRFSTSIPDSAQDKLEQIPQFLLGMFAPGVTLDPAGDAGNGRKSTGRRPKPAGAGSTTGGGVEVPGK